MNKTLIISLTAVFSALYAVGVILLAPISYGEIQVRVIDCLIPLSGVFGLPVILGVTLGNIVANVFGGLGVLDIVGGSIANLIASSAVYYILYLNKKSSSRILEIILVYSSTLLATAIITLIVGFYLAVIFSVPISMMMLSIFLGSFISITLLGGSITVILRSSTSIKNIISRSG
jgi:uncharacterized membrane protein